MSVRGADARLFSRSSWHSLWGAVYGNLMTCVAIFFLVLYLSGRGDDYQDAINAMSAQFGAKPAAHKKDDLQSRLGGEKMAKVEYSQDKMRVVFADPVLFESGSAQLKPSAAAPLSRLAEAILDLPNAVQVEGHTDDRPLLKGSKFSSNWELSAARAFAVLQFLQNCGVPSSRLSAIGYGEFKPLKPNDTPENRAENRRIEVVLVKAEKARKPAPVKPKG